MKGILLILLVILSPLVAPAQNWNAAISFGPGALISHYGEGPAWYGGFSLERVFAKRIGVGFDLAGANTGSTNSNYSAALFSFGGSFHFPRTGSSKADGFLMGGVTGAALENSSPMAFVGGGMNYWFKPHLGIRAELRDHFEGSGETHYIAVRFGIAFRW